MIPLPQYFSFDGSPGIWQENDRPLVLSGSKWLPANLARLSHEAEVIDQSEFRRLLNGAAMPPAPPKDDGEKAVTSQNGSGSGAGTAQDVQFNTTMPEDPLQEDEHGERDVWVSGRNGIKYPARYHAGQRRIRLIDHTTKTLKKANLGWELTGDVDGAVRNIFLYGNARDLAKAVDGLWFEDRLFKRHFSPDEMRTLNLRWITVHPNGEDPGVPIIVHDDGQHYTVVGGAGGKMNQMVFRKDDAEKGQKKANREAKVKQKAEAVAKVKEGDPESFQKLETAEKEYRTAAAVATEDYRKKAAEIIGANIDDLKETVSKEAERRAKKELGLDKKPESEHTDAEKADVQEFVDEAKKQVQSEVDAAVHAVVNQALDAVARAQINGEAVDADSLDAVKTLVNGKQLVKRLSDDDIKQLVEGSARIDHMRMQANIIRKALKSGKADVVQGIKAKLYDYHPTPAQIDEWTKNRYLNRESVITHTNLVKGSNLASERTQRTAQANGAADGLNHYISDVTGEAIMTPEVARRIGVENVARVAAAYLKTKGIDAKDLAGKLGDRIAEHSEADAAAALQTASQLDEIAKSAIEASRSGDGTVTAASARIISGNMATQKYRLLNTTRGRLRGAASLANELKNPNNEPMVIPGGSTKITAHAKAREVGLGRGTYVVKEQKNGGYAIEVPADKIANIANPMNIASAEANAAMDDLKQENDANWKEWNSPYLARPLFKHGVLAVKAISQQKRVLLNYGAGCVKGDTPLYDPIRNETRSFREWMEAGIAPHVYALSHGGKIVLAAASVPYIKAFETMYRVRTEGGKEITVAAGHRFLTPDGWLPLRQLSAGSFVASPADHVRVDQPPTPRTAVSPQRWMPSLHPNASVPFVLPTSSLVTLRTSFAPCKPLSPVRSLPECAPALRESSSGYDPSTRLSDGPNCASKPSGTVGRCSPSAQMDRGEQLPWEEDSGLALAPSPDGVLARSLRCLREDGQGGGEGRSPSCRLSVRPSSWDGRCQGLPSNVRSAEAQEPFGIRMPSFGSAQAFVQSNGHSPLRRGDDELQLRTLQDVILDPVLPLDTSGTDGAWDRIKVIEQMDTDDVFDLTVPQYHNYVATGLINHNSGKTGIIYGAISDLLGNNKVDKVLVSMPAKPRAQQENYTDDDGKVQTGEKFKFLKPELHDAVTVIKDSADFNKKKEKIKSGEIKAIFMSPELMRERQDDLTALGFGGERSAYMADEAHRLSAGEGEGEGSGMAKAAATFAKSEYVSLGCIHESSQIHDPVRGETRTIQEWMLAGIAPYVWSMGSEGKPVVAQASVPFIKCRSMMYDVTTESGNSIRVAGGHLFLTPDGWCRLDDLAPNALVAASTQPSLTRIAFGASLWSQGFGHDAPYEQSIVSPTSRKSLSDPGCEVPSDVRSQPLSRLLALAGYHARRLFERVRIGSRTLPGIPDHCSLLELRGDVRLLSEADTDLASSPSLVGVHEHSRDYRHEDGRADAGGHSRPYQPSDLLSKRGSSPLIEPLKAHLQVACVGDGIPLSNAYLEHSVFPCGLTRLAPLGLKAQSQQARGSVCHMPSASLGVPQALVSSSCDEYTLLWERVTIVKESGEADVYDLTVQEHHNYLAHGLWHHNTGTSIENNASELHSLLNMVNPEAYPKGGMKAFRQEWERQAATITKDEAGKTKLGGIFANEAMSKMRQSLAGTMLSYHEPARKKNGEEVGFERKVHHVPLTEDQKGNIRKLNETRNKEMASEDPKIRKAAPLRWQANVIRSVIGDSMFEEMANKVKEGRIKDPAFRAVVWASEIQPLLGGKGKKGLKDHFGDLGPTTQVTGANSDKQTKQALDAFNDRTNNHSALLVSNAGNFGINAQGGNAVFMAGHPLVYSNLDQLEHRVNRNGQEKDVESHIFIGDHPIMKQLFHRVMNDKGKSARLLEVMAHDDSPVGMTLAMNEKALKEAAGA